MLIAMFPFGLSLESSELRSQRDEVMACFERFKQSDSGAAKLSRRLTRMLHSATIRWGLLRSRETIWLLRRRRCRRRLGLRRRMR